jgi:hypothetical protein
MKVESRVRKAAIAWMIENGVFQISLTDHGGKKSTGAHNCWRMTCHTETIWCLFAYEFTSVVAQFTAFAGVIIAASISSWAAKRSSLML